MNRNMLLLFLSVLLFACNEEIEQQETNAENSRQVNNVNDVQREAEGMVEDEFNENKKESEKENEAELKALYKVNEKTSYIEPIDESTNKRVVLLTIDDAPDS